MSTAKRVFTLIALFAVMFYAGTKVRAKPSPASAAPSIAKFNSNVVKGTASSAGEVVVSQGNSTALWANVKGADIDSGAASNGMALLADGNGKANWGVIPANTAQLPKVRVFDNTGKATVYSTGAVIAFPAVDFDLGPVNGKSGMVGADNTKLTVQEAGVYLIVTHFTTKESANFDSIVINGKTQVLGNFSSSSGADTSVTMTAIVNCAQGTTIQVSTLYGCTISNDPTLSGPVELTVTKLP